MKQVTDILMSKQFLIGLGVGIAGVYAYNRYMRKENTSSATGDYTWCCCGIGDSDCKWVSGKTCDRGCHKSDSYFKQ